MKTGKYEIDMCNGTIMDKLISFSLPLMASSILQLMFNAVDIIVVGRFSGSQAIAAECALNGASDIVIINRNKERGQELAQLICHKTKCAGSYLEWKSQVQIPRGTEILINATSAGFSPNIKDKPDREYVLPRQ